MSTRTVSWGEVDEYVAKATERLGCCTASGVYGVPRGGLPLAVMLSHSLGLPLLASPYQRCIVVDDICDSGRTLKPYRDEHILTAMFLRNGAETTPNFYYELLTDDAWVVFPWENQHQCVP